LIPGIVRIPGRPSLFPRSVLERLLRDLPGSERLRKSICIFCMRIAPLLPSNSFFMMRQRCSDGVLREFRTDISDEPFCPRCQVDKANFWATKGESCYISLDGVERLLSGEEMRLAGGNVLCFDRGGFNFRDTNEDRFRRFFFEDVGWLAWYMGPAV